MFESSGIKALLAKEGKCAENGPRKGNKELWRRKISWLAERDLRDSRWASESNLFRPGTGLPHFRRPSSTSRGIGLSRLSQSPDHNQCRAQESPHGAYAVRPQTNRPTPGFRESR